MMSEPAVSRAEDAKSNPKALTLLRAAQNTEKRGNKKGALEFYALTVKRYPLSLEAKSAITRIQDLGGKVPTADEYENQPAINSEEQQPVYLGHLMPSIQGRPQALGRKVPTVNEDENSPAVDSGGESDEEAEKNQPVDLGNKTPSTSGRLARIRFQGGTGVSRQGGKKRLGHSFELPPGFTSEDQLASFAFGGGTVLRDGSIVLPRDNKMLGDPLPVRSFDGSPDMVNSRPKTYVMRVWHWDQWTGIGYWRNVVYREQGWRVR
jgi:hypothetical protein